MSDESNAMPGGAGHQPADSKAVPYEVGYGKPPKATQFKKGRSGNPKGAKKKAAIDDVRVMVEAVLSERVNLRDGKRDLKVPRLEAILRSQRLKALNGDPKAAKAIFKLSQKTGLFSQAKPRSNIVLDEPGSPEQRMLLRAYRREQGLDTSENPEQHDKSSGRN